MVARAPMLPPAILLAPGHVRSLAVPSVERIAIGNPAVIDVTIISPTELLIQAKSTGSTNLILWDATGQHQLTVSIVDPQAEVVAHELTELLHQFNFPWVNVTLQSGKIFLSGNVDTQAEWDALSQMASAFGDAVVNLVTVTAAATPPEETPPLVKLSVQVLDISRGDLERLGVKWSDTLTITEPQVEDRTFTDALRRWGTSLTRTSASATLNALVQKNKARILAEPKLVTASGKEASSFIGLEVPIITSASSGGLAGTSVTVDFRETGVLLKMTPRVLTGDQERKITTTINAEVSAIDRSVALTLPVGVVPGFKSREVTTEVTTASGETIMIAGLLETEDTRTMSQVPALGSIPGLGRLFRQPEAQTTQREMVIAVTPELLLDEGTQAERGLALEQALAVAEVTASVEDPRLRYALQIQDRIAKALRYPMRERELNLAGTVKLRLHLFADGTLGRAMVAESSGFESLDLEALKAAESQSPYPGFPSQLLERELWLELPVIFRPS